MRDALQTRLPYVIKVRTARGSRLLPRPSEPASEISRPSAFAESERVFLDVIRIDSSARDFFTQRREVTCHRRALRLRR